MQHFAPSRSLIAVLFMILGLILTACGTRVTELKPTFEPTTTFDFSARLAGQSDGSEIVQEPAILPSITPIPPTATSIPEPTEVPTEEVAEVPTEVALELPGDPAIGEILFNNVMALSTGQNCALCHNVNEPIADQGPYLYGIANVEIGGDAPRQAESLQEYLYQSIVNPNAQIAPSQGEKVWNVGVMPQDWLASIGLEEDIWHIVAYLMTLDQPRSE